LTGKGDTGRCQAISVARRPSALRRRLPLGFEIAVGFEPDKQRIKRARFHARETAEFIPM
jgi:hypothetical protein